MERHFYGIITKQHDAWWLAEFPELDDKPIDLFPLTGTLTTGLGRYLQSETRSPTPLTRIEDLNPEADTIWSGEFGIVPDPDKRGYYLVDAHPWGSQASKIEEAGTLAMIAQQIRYKVP